jgi:superfamily I DNA/RNA helicase
VSIGRTGPPPLLIQLPSLNDEAIRIAEYLQEAHGRGTCWSDMAVLYRHYDPVGKTLASTLRRAGVPVMWQKDVRFAATQDTVKLMSMHASKGLEYPVVVLAGLGLIDADNPAESKDEARILYVAMTRATQELVMTCDRQTTITQRLVAASASV